MPLGPHRAYSPLKVKRREVPFSFWPVKKITTRYALQSVVFTTDPWSLIANCIRQASPPGVEDEALGFLEQAQDYYSSATSSAVSAAKPVLLYYSYLNLVKSFLLHRGVRPTYDARAMHGLSEKITPGGTELLDAYLEAYASGASINIFDDFLRSISGAGLPATTSLTLVNLMPQIVPGHRVWSSAADQPERFVSVHEVVFAQQTNNKQLWTNIFIDRGDLGRLGTTQNQVLALGGIAPQWQRVKAPEEMKNQCVLLEQAAATTYGMHPTQILSQVAHSLKPHLWTTILSVPPYRKHYLYLCPAAEVGSRLPQLLSMYALMYYLGSITRYRPHHFDKITETAYGGFIQSCLADQPTQFLYLMASEFAKQEVTKPAIV